MCEKMGVKPKTDELAKNEYNSLIFSEWGGGVENFCPLGR